MKRFLFVLTASAFQVALTPCASAGFDDALPQVREKGNLTGQTFWAYLNRSSCEFVGPKLLSEPKVLGAKQYRSDHPVKVAVGPVAEDSPAYAKFYKVTIDDSEIAYLSTGFRVEEANAFTLRNGCALTQSPEQVTAALAAAAEEDARATREAESRDLKRKAQARLPGVRVGMSAKQVVESTSWGEPDSINRTVTGAGVDDQWVYAGGSYLYFHNGRLRAIQN